MLIALSKVLKVACAAAIAYGLIFLTFGVVQYAVLPVLIAITGGGS